MKFAKGNMFDKAIGPIFVTTSAFLISDGSLMMNRGAAAVCSKRHPNASKMFGSMAKRYGVIKRNDFGNKFFKFGCLYDSETELGVFQVKYHFKDDVDINLLKYSAAMLSGISRILCNVNMNFPGCGYGKVDRYQVIKTLDDILDNDITVWRLDASEYGSFNHKVDSAAEERAIATAESLIE